MKRLTRKLRAIPAEFKGRSAIERMSLLMDIYTPSIGKSEVVFFLFSRKAPFPLLPFSTVHFYRSDRKLRAGPLLHFGAALPRRYLLLKRGNDTCDLTLWASVIYVLFPLTRLYLKCYLCYIFIIPAVSLTWYIQQNQIIIDIKFVITLYKLLTFLTTQPRNFAIYKSRYCLINNVRYIKRHFQIILREFALVLDITISNIVWYPRVSTYKSLDDWITLIAKSNGSRRSCFRVSNRATYIEFPRSSKMSDNEFSLNVVIEGKGSRISHKMPGHNIFLRHTTTMSTLSVPVCTRDSPMIALKCQSG